MMPASFTRFSRSRRAASDLSNWILSCSNSASLSACLHLQQAKEFCTSASALLVYTCNKDTKYRPKYSLDAVQRYIIVSNLHHCCYVDTCTYILSSLKSRCERGHTLMRPMSSTACMKWYPAGWMGEAGSSDGVKRELPLLARRASTWLIRASTWPLLQPALLLTATCRPATSSSTA